MRKIYMFFIQQYRQLLLLSMVAFIGLQVYAQPCTLSANTIGFNASYVQIYVLTDNTGIILDQNTTGTFNVNVSGTYYIHALNYDPLSPPNPLPSVIIGSPITNVGSISQGCYNLDFLTDNVQRTCGCESFCSGSSVLVTTTGFNAGYSQVYVLTDSLGMIIAVNGSGDFTLDVSVGHTYNVHALNYNPSDPPIPFPMAGSMITSVGSTAAGCINNDFLTDIHCITINACNTCQQNHDVYQGDSFTSDCTGWAAGGYSQLYFLVDSLGVIQDMNAIGTFSYNYPIGSNYRVYALNYSLSDPPIPLPTYGEYINSIGSTSGGCYNADFLSDFVCMKVIGLVVLDQNELTLIGRKSSDTNILEWSVNSTVGNDYFELERSEKGNEFTKIVSRDGVNPTNTTENYSYIDSVPFPNKNYYRVRQIDLDGNVFLSNIVLLQNVVDVQTQVFPNPFKNELTIVMEGGTGNAEFSLYNELGQYISRNIFVLDKTINTFSVSTHKLSEGVYYYKIITSEQTISGKIVKVKE